MKAQMQKGFTLIELMIVVAIIGILAAIALPAYQDYTNRAKMTEVLTFASAGRTAVAEYFQSTGTLPANNTEAGLDVTPANISSDYVTSVTIGTGGVVTVEIEGTGVSALDNGNVQLTPRTNAGTALPTDGSYSGPLTWLCEPSANTLNKYFPASCRKS